MKQYITLLFLFICCLAGTTAVAQTDSEKERRENVESAKIAFLTDKMALTPDQAQKFWPIYKEFETKRREIYHSNRGSSRKKVEEMTDAEVKAMVDGIFVLKQKELNLEQEYATKYQRVISTRQLAELYRGEREFTKMLLKKLDHKPQ
ncbi:hypothetical protein FVR03_06080 [Pontibacter qinzhouensis]|uniref:Sensor of ECF-type sigma factor n=1 Tax=Pontibacter qinzhouensis TaxID=2603253 RepID=A0A5C8KCR1_9BACT|nr:hypothetical protein [Pontibacter qinzhouensis]TXK49658.1 hypothetical protein FVR03_06080 [Pontibacter qinzhouensis]